MPEDSMETHHASKIMAWFQACWKALLSAKEENFNQEKKKSNKVTKKGKKHIHPVCTSWPTTFPDNRFRHEVPTRACP